MLESDPVNTGKRARDYAYVSETAKCRLVRMEEVLSTYTPSLITAKTFHNCKMISFIQFLGMMHIHKRRATKPANGSQQMQTARIGKIRHSRDSLQDPKARNGTPLKLQIQQLA